MKRIIRHSQLSDPEGANALCTDKMCLALSSVLIYPTTHERMTGQGVSLLALSLKASGTFLKLTVDITCA
jgi:hypothetical protein